MFTVPVTMSMFLLKAELEKTRSVVKITIAWTLSVTCYETLLAWKKNQILIYLITFATKCVCDDGLASVSSYVTELLRGGGVLSDRPWAMPRFSLHRL